MTNRVKCVICNNIKVPYSQRIRETGVCFSCTRRIIPKHIPQSQHIKYLKTKGYNKKPKYLRCKRCKRCNKLVILCNNKIRETCICFQCVKYLVPNHIPEEKH